LLLVFPNGDQSEFDTGSAIVRPGERFPGKPGYVLDRLDLSDKPMPDGRYVVVGILRERDTPE
jgi:hypothetical protein